jgi:hypothetical protein
MLLGFKNLPTLDRNLDFLALTGETEVQARARLGKLSSLWQMPLSAEFNPGQSIEATPLPMPELS